MILLSRAYKGYAAGTVVQFQTSEENALIAAGYGATSSAAPTAGAVTADTVQGRAAIAAGAGSVVITNAYVDATSKIFAVIAQAAADGTALYVARVVPAAGSFTIYANANATAATVVDWIVLNPSGVFQSH